MLEDYAEKNGFTGIRHFTDDGISSAAFEREGLQAIQAAYKESQSLKGLAIMRYDKEHNDSLSKYLELKKRMQSLLQNGEKITPKQWKAEVQSLQSEYDSIGKEQTKAATEAAAKYILGLNSAFHVL